MHRKSAYFMDNASSIVRSQCQEPIWVHVVVMKGHHTQCNFFNIFFKRKIILFLKKGGLVGTRMQFVLR